MTTPIAVPKPMAMEKIAAFPGSLGSMAVRHREPQADAAADERAISQGVGGPDLCHRFLGYGSSFGSENHEGGGDTDTSRTFILVRWPFASVTTTGLAVLQNLSKFFERGRDGLGRRRSE